MIRFDAARPLDVIPLGRVAIDFNPTDYFKPLSESQNFNKYLGGSQANIAVGLARLGRKVGFLTKVSDEKNGSRGEAPCGVQGRGGPGCRRPPRRSAKPRAPFANPPDSPKQLAQPTRKRQNSTLIQATIAPRSHTPQQTGGDSP